MSRCIGCGTIIQSNDSTKPGYVPESALVERGENVYCKRCFDIRHHNIKYLPENNLANYYDKIKIIKEEKALVILLVDVLDICGGFIPDLHKYIGSNKVLLLINKVDVLPKKMKLLEIENFVRSIAKKSKLNVESIMFGSVTNPSFVERVIKKITKLKYPSKNTLKYKKQEERFGNCYVIGHASVGKSTFMNQIGKMYLHHEKDIITTSSQFQTTLDFIKWPLDQKSYIIDTPGIINPHNFGAYLDSESVNILRPKKFIKPRTYQLNPDQTIFLGGLVRIDFSGNSKINVNFYVSNDLYLHRTKTIQADHIIETQYMKMLVPPVNVEEASKIKDIKTVKFIINKSANLFISGIGFIHIVAEDALINVKLPKMIDVEMMIQNDE